MSAAAAVGVERLEIPFDGRTVNAYLLHEGGQAVLVDTGVAGAIGACVVPALRGLGLGLDSLRLAVITHADYDHMGGNAELAELAPGCALACHHADAAWIGDLDLMIAERYDEFGAGDGMALAPGAADAIRRSAGSAPIARRLAAGEPVAVGSHELLVVELPGHSPGHIGLLDPISRDLYAGDAVMGIGLPGSDGATPALPPSYRDRDAYLATIARLRAIAPERLLTGHFPPLAGDEVDRFLAISELFLTEFGERVERQLSRDRPRATAEICAAVAAGSPWWPRDPAAAEVAFPVCAHLEALAAEGRVALGVEDGRRAWRLAG